MNLTSGKKLCYLLISWHTRRFTCGCNESAFEKRYGAWSNGRINLPRKGKSGQQLVCFQREGYCVSVCIEFYLFVFNCMLFI